MSGSYDHELHPRGPARQLGCYGHSPGYMHGPAWWAGFGPGPHRRPARPEDAEDYLSDLEAEIEQVKGTLKEMKPSAHGQGSLRR